MSLDDAASWFMSGRGCRRSVCVDRGGAGVEGSVSTVFLLLCAHSAADNVV